MWNIDSHPYIQHSTFKTMKILGIDYGHKRIGLSLGDTQARMATIFGIIENKGEVVKEVCDIVKKEGLKELLLVFLFRMKGR
jgi:RNase H-fold protein (predicted Holliday junction resolvase)